MVQLFWWSNKLSKWRFPLLDFDVFFEFSNACILRYQTILKSLWTFAHEYLYMRDRLKVIFYLNHMLYFSWTAECIAITNDPFSQWLIHQLVYQFTNNSFTNGYTHSLMTYSPMSTPTHWMYTYSANDSFTNWYTISPRTHWPVTSIQPVTNSPNASFINDSFITGHWSVIGWIDVHIGG